MLRRTAALALCLLMVSSAPLSAQDRPLPPDLRAVYDGVRAQLSDPSAPFGLVVSVRAVEGRAADLATAYAAHAVRSRQEPGVLAFDVYRPQVASRIVLHERYASLAAFEQHLRGASLAQFVKDADGLIVDRTPLVVAHMPQPPADTPPPDTTTGDAPRRLRLDTMQDNRTGARRLQGIVVSEPGAPPRRIAYEQLIRPSVETYAQAPIGIPVVFGVPAQADQPAGLVAETGAELPAPPSPQDRAALLTDDRLNSGLFNLSTGEPPGLRLRFPEDGLLNGPGPDLLIVEISLPAGETSAGCPDASSLGGDPFVLSVAGGEARHRVRFGPDAFQDVGPAGAIANYGWAQPHAAEQRMASTFRAGSLEALEVRPLAIVHYFHLFAAAVDLSALGVDEGESIRSLDVSSDPEAIDIEDHAATCFHIDPVLILGLLPASDASPASPVDPHEHTGVRATVDTIIERVRTAVPDAHTPFVLAVHVEAQPQHVGAVAASYADQARRARQVPGNLAYDLHRDPAAPNRLFLYQRWARLDAFIHHERSAYTLAHFERVAPLLTSERELFILTPVNTPVK